IITSREMFYGTESVPQVVKKHLVPNSMPCYVWYYNNCSLFKYCTVRAGKHLRLNVGLTVDIFYWKCKHKKTDIECSFHCNPHLFQELLKDDNTWFFQLITNVWFGGYHMIVREMGVVKYEFFLDEMLLQKNKLTWAKL
ncbi:uncharacterized protein TRAVEDRAFT_78044, partial [Trametes versicolor FP-101664 SS1]|uniref:uncharacterized protein n=1 Tax=Trametes versicolor (strain FP-101664) TaxID=717944 RepID=UPI0004624988